MGRWLCPFFFAAAVLAAAPPLELISSAEICGGCHRAIHEAWKRSAHAAAVESLLFQEALAVAGEEFGERARAYCLGCHAPLAVHLGDFVLKQKPSREGVTCDWCHSVRRVRSGDRGPAAVVEFSLIKTGPLKGSRAMAHGTRFAKVHTGSAICAPCHQHRTAEGLDVLSTYEEWRRSRYARQHRPCQSCHLSELAGDVVDPRIEASPGARINLHEMPGSKSVNQLNRAVRAVLTAVRKADGIEVEVEVANTGAGHAMPTGSPMRELVLEVEARTPGGQRFTQTRRYRRVVADRDGRTIETEPVALFRAAKVVSDTRLGPQERRLERFYFPVAAGAPAQILARLVYRYAPLARPDSEQRVVFRTISRSVR